MKWWSLRDSGHPMRRGWRHDLLSEGTRRRSTPLIIAAAIPRARIAIQVFAASKTSTSMENSAVNSAPRTSVAPMFMSPIIPDW